MKQILFTVLMGFSSFALANPTCSFEQQAQALVASIASRESINCEADVAQKILVCHPPSGNVVLDLVQDSSTLTAEGYWSSAQATVWVSIHVQTELQAPACIATDYSFDSAVED